MLAPACFPSSVLLCTVVFSMPRRLSSFMNNDSGDSPARNQNEIGAVICAMCTYNSTAMMCDVPSRSPLAHTRTALLRADVAGRLLTAARNTRGCIVPSLVLCMIMSVCWKLCFSHLGVPANTQFVSGLAELHLPAPPTVPATQRPRIASCTQPECNYERLRPCCVDGHHQPCFH